MRLTVVAVLKSVSIDANQASLGTVDGEVVLPAA